ncbi:hypothetical protein GCM10022408_21300 [Hymenobacter fastidiosus]|uniref:Uncharacterized protein n=1 Tax=Hymenobacter fastidiosus TaxID=486264 RepID=A0ABP7SAR3_9BACT
MCLLALLLILKLHLDCQTRKAPVVNASTALANRGYRQALQYLDRHWVALRTGPAGAYGYERHDRIDSVGLRCALRRYTLGSGRRRLEQPAPPGAAVYAGYGIQPVL